MVIEQIGEGAILTYEIKKEKYYVTLLCKTRRPYLQPR